MHVGRRGGIFEGVLVGGLGISLKVYGARVSGFLGIGWKAYW